LGFGEQTKMTIGQELLQELSLEAEVTRRFLERVPFDKAKFRPHEKSEQLNHLAIHVAEIITWWKECIDNYELNFAYFKQKEIKTTDELLSYFDDLLAGAKKALADVKDEELEKNWSMTHGVDILFTLPKKQVLRLFCMNHLVHHRAQLGTYLRLLDIPVPAVYGPSADDENVILITQFQNTKL
jgi:uncharacterized damage-inducible protein DinB